MKQLSRFILLLLAAILPLTAAADDKRATTRIDKSISIFNDVLRQLDMNYTDTLNYDLLTETALSEMLKKVDPYTVYVPESQDEDLKRMTTGKYGGIGAMIMLRGNYVIISDPYEGLPAQVNDVRAGDTILAVDGVDCKGKTTPEVSNLLRGKAGTTVTLSLRRGGEKKPIKKEFLREEIKLPTVPYYAMVTDQIGYIAFSEFTENSSKEFRKALDELSEKEGCQQLIIDLRGNGGGLITEALSIVSNFVDKGTEIVTTKGKTDANSRSYKTTVHPSYKDMPLVILVDDNSASASEITCGSLQDLKRATLIGEKTYGKGLVQNIRPVVYNGHLKVTIARYYLPSGRCIQGTGIEPDIAITDSQKVNICYELYKKNMFFDFATQYAATHPTYPMPSPRINAVTEGGDTLLAAFEDFLRSRSFTYETETSKYLADLLKFAEQEDLDSAMMADLRGMKERLSMTYHDALIKHKEEVLNFLEGEIVTRYYFQKGSTCIHLRRDKELLRAIEYLEQGK